MIGFLDDSLLIVITFPLMVAIVTVFGFPPIVFVSALIIAFAALAGGIAYGISESRKEDHALEKLKEELEKEFIFLDETFGTRAKEIDHIKEIAFHMPNNMNEVENLLGKVNEEIKRVAKEINYMTVQNTAKNSDLIAQIHQTDRTELYVAQLNDTREEIGKDLPVPDDTEYGTLSSNSDLLPPSPEMSQSTTAKNDLGTAVFSASRAELLSSKNLKSKSG